MSILGQLETNLSRVGAQLAASPALPSASIYVASELLRAAVVLLHASLKSSSGRWRSFTCRRAPRTCSGTSPLCFRATRGGARRGSRCLTCSSAATAPWTNCAAPRFASTWIRTTTTTRRRSSQRYGESASACCAVVRSSATVVDQSSTRLDPPERKDPGRARRRDFRDLRSARNSVPQESRLIPPTSTGW